MDDDTPQLDSAKCAKIIDECARHLGLAIGEILDYAHHQPRGWKKTIEGKEQMRMVDKALRLIDRLKPMYGGFEVSDGPGATDVMPPGNVRVIGERLTSGNKSVKDAIPMFFEHDIADLARWQAQSGAHYLDVGAAALGEEYELVNLAWLTRIAEDASRRRLSLDCQNPEALRWAVGVCRWAPIWNSLCPAAGTVDEILTMLKEGLPCAGVVAVLQKTWGEYLAADERVDLAQNLADQLAGAGIPPERWIFDPVTLPQSAGSEWSRVTLETIARLRERFPQSSVLCAVSNYSFGLRERRPANRAWAKQALDAGADVFLCDPLDSQLMQSLPRLQRWP